MDKREEMLAAGSVLYFLSFLVAGLWVVPYFTSLTSVFSFLSGLGALAPSLAVSALITLPVFVLFLWASDKAGVEAEIAA